MKLGLALRNMGPASRAKVVRDCARAADAAGLDSLWVADHIAIPPDDAEGSGGRYLDPLATLAFLAAATERIGLGTGVLNLPYRPPLPTAKWVSTIQELSGGRLLLGVGTGWMEAEFRALGVPRSRRGRDTDATLAFLHSCFERDEVEAHGQKFLFSPRPPRPPILVGGAPPHAFDRILRFGDGWMPIGLRPEKLRPLVAQLRERAEAAGRPRPEVVTFASFPAGDPAHAADLVAAFGESGVDRLIHGTRYADLADLEKSIELLASL
ncbi:MAG: TIGR03619 family F420-dependent LLM class oxidoreductase [Myxococcota bacterium]